MIYDVVIIGAGVAGLYAAMNIPKDKKVLIINKNHPWECNTFYAQGGVVCAVDDKDEDLHIQDTMEAGAGLCDEEAVRVLSENSRKVVTDLINRGFNFEDLFGAGHNYFWQSSSGQIRSYALVPVVLQYRTRCRGIAE
jgi:L-aspartate oxidase